MNGSGLGDTFEEVYSGDTIKYILSRHAVTRALRAHQVKHISNTLIDEENLSVSGLEYFFSIAMENGLNKEQIADANNDAFSYTFKP